ncbi:hypothetical protein [Methylocapsa acidiphila]|uniref:hypothetical protein n=1 Tax=Methylocapsa acidiphila TaxID=133552 RepID=UPI000416801C|nr:hypothetical protein [Methylocapsa acidiphila]
MVFGKVGPRETGVAGVCALAVLILAALAGVSPAKAQEDTNTFNSMLGFFGMQFDKEQDSIDYRARAPIVVPPKLDLPPPKEAVRSAAWPTDPDVAERRRAAIDSRRPAPQLTPNARAELSQAELQHGVSANKALPSEGPASECQASSGTPICLYAPWKSLQNTLAGTQGDDQPQLGEEPERRYLTEPPPGYRKATATAKATIEAPREQPDAADPKAYIRSQQHKFSVDN